jgi:hypothetical protein
MAIDDLNQTDFDIEQTVTALQNQQIKRDAGRLRLQQELAAITEAKKPTVNYTYSSVSSPIRDFTSDDPYYTNPSADIIKLGEQQDEYIKQGRDRIVREENDHPFFSTARLTSGNPFVAVPANIGNFAAGAAGSTVQIGRGLLGLAAQPFEPDSSGIPEPARQVMNTMLELERQKVDHGNAMAELRQQMEAEPFNTSLKGRLQKLQEETPRSLSLAEQSLLSQKIAGSDDTYESRARRIQAYTDTVNEMTTGTGSDILSGNREWANHSQTEAIGRRVAALPEVRRLQVLINEAENKGESTLGLKAQQVAAAAPTAALSGLTDPSALGLILAESAPYIATAAIAGVTGGAAISGLSMAGEQFNRGRQQLADREGKHIISSRDAAMLTGTSALYGASEFIQDRLMLGALGRTAAKAVKPSAVKGTARMALAPITGVGKVALAEGAVEGLQQVIEEGGGIGDFDSVSGTSVGTAAGLGAAAGIAMGGAGQTWQDFKKGANQVLNSSGKVEEPTFSDLPTEELLDASKPTYDPIEAANRAMYTATQAATEAQRTIPLAEAAKALDKLQSDYDEVVGSGNSLEMQLAKKQQLLAGAEKLAVIKPEDMKPKIEAITASIDKLTTDIAKNAATRDALKARVEESKALRDKLNELVAPVTTEATVTADSVPDIAPAAMWEGIEEPTVDTGVNEPVAAEQVSGETAGVVSSSAATQTMTELTKLIQETQALLDEAGMLISDPSITEEEKARASTMYEHLMGKLGELTTKQRSLERLQSPVDSDMSLDLPMFEELMSANPTKDVATRASKAANDLSNGLTDAQRQKLRILSESIVEMNATKNIETVTGDITSGGGKSIKYVSLSQYLQDFAQATKDKTGKVTNSLYKKLTEFQRDHAAKEEAIREAISITKEGYMTFVTRSGKDWVVGKPDTVANAAPKSASVRINAGVTVTSNSASGLLEAIEKENAAINRLVDNVERVYLNVDSTPITTTPGVTQTTTPVASTTTPVSTPVVAEEETQWFEEFSEQPPSNNFDGFEESDYQDSGVAYDEFGDIIYSDDTVTIEVDAAVEDIFLSTEEVATAGKELAGKLSIFEGVTDEVVAAEKAKLLESNGESVAGFQKANLVITGFKQTKKVLLTVVRDVMSNLNSPVVRGLIAAIRDTNKTNNQIVAMQGFLTLHKQLTPILEQLMLSTNEDYRYKDFLQFMMVDGKLDQNLMTAITAAIHDHIVSDGGKLFKKERDIRKMLGDKSENGYLDPLAYNDLHRRGDLRSQVIMSLGANAYAALGLSSNKDEATTRKERLIFALGSAAFATMESAKLVETSVMPAWVYKLHQDVLAGKAIYEFIDENTLAIPAEYEGQRVNALMNDKITFTRLATTQDSYGYDITTAAVNIVIDTAKGSGGFVANLFGTNNAKRQPMTRAPKKLAQTTINNTGVQVPSQLADKVAAMMRKPYRISKDMVATYNGLLKTDPELLYSMLGVVSDAELQTLHVVKRKRQTAINETIKKDLMIALETVESIKTNVDGEYVSVYLPMDVWVVNRVGVTSTALNDQGSKIHRSLMAMATHRVEVTVEPPIVDGKVTTFGNFILSIGSVMEDLKHAVGKSPDKINAETFIPSFMDYLATDRVQEAITAMQMTMQGESISAEARAALESVIAESGGGPMAIQAMTMLVAYKEAKDGKFTTEMAIESDGVNNGVAISEVLYGTVSPELMAAVGLYGEDSPVRDVPNYLTRGGKDYYTSSGQVMREKLDGLQAAYYMQKARFEEMLSNGLSESEAAWVNQKIKGLLDPSKVLPSLALLDPKYGSRSGAKPMLIPANYNASIPSIKRAGAREVVKGFYGMLEAAHNQAVDNKANGLPVDIVGFQSAIVAINTLITAMNQSTGDRVPTVKLGSINNALELVLTPEQEFTVMQADILSRGVATAEAITEISGAMGERRSALLAATNIGFELFNQQYENAVAAKVAERKAAGTLPFRTGKQDGEQVEQYLEGLSAQEEDVILAGLLENNNSIISVNGLGGKNPNESAHVGYSWSKAVYEGVDVPAVSKFNNLDTNLKNKTWSFSGYPARRKLEPVGLGMAAGTIQAVDAYVATTVAAQMDAANRHDAHAASVDSVQAVAKAQNRAFFNAITKYHLNSQGIKAMLKPIKGYLANPNKALSDEALFSIAKSFGAAVNTKSNKSDYYSSKNVAQLIRGWFKAAYTADIEKLNKLKQVKFINQYGTEAGYLELTSKDYARIDAQIAKLTASYKEQIAEIELLANEFSAAYSAQLQASDGVQKFIAKHPQANSTEGRMALWLRLNTRKAPAATASPVPVKGVLPNRQGVSSAVANKDQAKWSISNKYIGFGAEGTSTAAYAYAIDKALVNQKEYVATDKVYVSLNGGNRPTNASNFAKTLDLVAKAIAAGATIVIDTKQYRESNDYVSGDRKLATWLLANGYTEVNGTGSFVKGVNVSGVGNLVTSSVAPTKRITGKALQEVIAAKAKEAAASKSNHWSAKLEAALWKKFSTMSLGNTSLVVGAADVLDKGVTNGRYNRVTGLIQLLDKGNGGTAVGLLHELIHAATAVNLETNPVFNTEVTRIREAARKQLGQLSDYYEYAFKTNAEFVAVAMSDAAFQDLLNKIVIPQNRGVTTALVAFVKGLLESFGLDYRFNEQSAMAALLNTMTKKTFKVSNGDYGSLDLPTFTDAEAVVNRMTPRELFDSLDGGNTTNLFAAKLASQVSNVLSKTYGVLDSLTSVIGTNDQSAKDVWEATLASGRNLYSTRMIDAGFSVSDKERFAMETIEVVVAESLNKTFSSNLYRQVRAAYDAARTNLTPESFHDGDWLSATQSQRNTAIEKYNTLFRVGGNGGINEYLSRFVAASLACEEVATILGFAVAKPSNKNKSLLELLQAYVVSTFQWANSYMVKTSSAMTIAEKMPILAKQLISVHRTSKQSSIETVLDGWYTTIRRADPMLKKIGPMTSKLFKPLTKTDRFSGIAEVTIDTLNGNLMKQMDAIKEWRDSELPNQKYGWKAEMLNELNNPSKAMSAMVRLIRKHTSLQATRDDIAVATYTNVTEMFKDKGKYLTAKNSAALTNGLLRTNVHVLMDSIGIAGIEELLRSSGKRSTLRKALEGEILAYENGRLLVNRCKDLALYQTIGEGRVGLVKNTLSISQGVGSQEYSDQVDPVLIELLDRYTAVQAIQYTNGGVREELSRLFNIESYNTYEALATVLKYHASLQKEAKNTLFEGNERSIQQGWMPEISNTHRDLQIVGDTQTAKEMKNRGYIAVGQMRVDPNDPEQAPRVLFMNKDAGQQRFVTGSMSLTSTHSKGAAAFARADMTDKERFIAMKQTDNGVANALLKKAKQVDYDPRVEPVSMIGHYSNSGTTLDYYYEMDANTRNGLLQRNNNFAKLLGAYAANIFDKVESPKHNENVVNHLAKQYFGSKPEEAKKFVLVGTESTDPALREMWAMLPNATKAFAEDKFGTTGMYVSNEVLRSVFGFRKLSVSNSFDKNANERNVLEKLVVGAFEAAAGKKARAVAIRTQRANEEIVAFVKSSNVIRNLSTLVGNQSANMGMLSAAGVGILEVYRSSSKALAAGIQYQKDKAALVKVTQQISARIGNLSTLDSERNRILDSMAKNPLAEFLEEGMLSTIVEDISTTNDEYSYGSALMDKLDKSTQWVSPAIKEMLSFAFVTPSSSIFKLLAAGTQMSDFTAKYTIYNHERNKGVSHEDAVAVADRMFISYDVPTSPEMQALNDNGLVMYTKYYMRIQRALMYLIQEKPSGVVAQGALAYGLGTMGALDPLVFTNVGNPFGLAATDALSAVGQPLPIKLLLGF